VIHGRNLQPVFSIGFCDLKAYTNLRKAHPENLFTGMDSPARHYSSSESIRSKKVFRAIDHTRINSWKIFRYQGHDQKRCIRTSQKCRIIPESFLFIMHEGLPRQGPGSTVCTQRMFSFLPGLPEIPKILDIGCGSGMQTIDLARLCPTACITAVDVYPAFLEEVNKRSIAAGFSDRIRTIRVSMDDLPCSPESFDLIWAEGSIFIIGVEQGITLWKKFLKPGDFLGFTEATWLTKSPSEKVRSFWRENYPGMKTVDEIKTITSQAGYTSITDFPLPASAWWVDYYIPLLIRLPAMEHQFRGKTRAEAIILLTRQEIELFEKYSTEYGYQFFLPKIRRETLYLTSSFRGGQPLLLLHAPSG
jgi:ubiquinone/menaquinone biosynthesis C-methylase UbiE